MQLVFTPYMLPLLLSAAVSGVLGFILGGRKAPGSRPIAVILLAIMVWSLAYLLEIGSPAYETKVNWATVEYVAIACLPVAWIIFALHYSGRERWLNPGRVVLISLIPLATLVLFWTNDVHRLVWTEASLDSSGPFLALVPVYGIVFWVFIAYAYTVLLAGVSILISFLTHTTPWYSRQVIPLVLGILIPWVGNILYVFKLTPIRNLDLTPIAFAISGVVLLWGVFRSSLFDLVPVARATVVDRMKDGVLIFDHQDRLIDINSKAAGILGIRLPESVGQKAGLILARFPDLAVEADGTQETHLELTVNEGNEQRYYDVQISPLIDRRHRPEGRFLILHDTTRQKQAEQELEKSHALLLATFQATADGIMVTNGRGKSIRVNQKFLDMWQMPEEMAASDDDQTRMAFILDQLVNPAEYYRLVNKLSVQPDAESYDVLELKNGRIFERYSRPQRIGDQRVGRVWSFHDVTEQHQAEERLRFLSTHDILTGLYNRVYFEEEINRLEGSRQYPISLIVADMDGLKQTNDRYGHQAGDAMLRKAAEILKQACRSEDMVARIGGDEFGIVLPKSNAKVAETAVERIKNGMGSLRFGAADIAISLSLGAATAQSGDSLRTIFRQADKSMYQAKRAKRQRRSQDIVLDRD